MTGPVDQPAEVLQRLQGFQSALEDANDSSAATFTGRAEDNTVEATVDGRLWLTDLHIDDSLLRLGAETVGLRVDEAIRNAQAAAKAAASAQHDQLVAKLADIAGELKAALGAD